MRQRFRNRKRRAERQEEAATRQASYDALSVERKLDRTTFKSFEGLGGSKRETNRLLGLVRPILADRLA